MAKRVRPLRDRGAVGSAVARLPGPERTCVGCRARGAKATLLRIVVVEDQGICCLVVDLAGRLPGRGAHLHPDLQCAELAEKRRAYARALRLDRPPDTSAVRAHLQQAASPQPPRREQADDPMSPR